MPYDITKDAVYKRPEFAKNPARFANAVTPNDSTDLAEYATSLYIGTAGNLVVLPVGHNDGATITLANHPVGYCPIQVRRVLATGTTASNIVALVSKW
jgi:hypothetical protein